MIRTGRSLTLGCLLLLSPLLSAAGGNSLLIPATARCTLNTLPEELPDALRACQQAASQGDLQAAYELGEFHYDGRRAPRDLNKEALDTADRVSAQMRRDELEIAVQVLGQIFRNYLMDLQTVDNPR